jgi:hypothetical protein
MSGEPPRLVNAPEEGESGNVFSVPSRVVARELRVPLHDPPQSRPLPFDPDSGPLRRFSPRKTWAEVSAFDSKLGQLDRHRVELGEKIGRLEQEIREARLADKQAVAEWQLEGAKGKHPTATAPALEAELEQVRSDVESTAIAEDRILKQKTAFVERHRKRLVSDASKARGQAVKRLQEAITALEQAREEATAALETERWAREYPSADANPGSLSLPLLKGGRLSKAVPDVRTIMTSAAVLAWLRDDAAWLDLVLADNDAERPLDPHEQAVWENTEEGRQALALANQRVALGLRPRGYPEAEWID